jgi:EEF1A lysine methyltransferase 2
LKTIADESTSWDNYYENDLDNEETDEPLPDPSDLESWFDDVDAPAKVLEYLTGPFPLSEQRDTCSVLDLGTGNGSMLFHMCKEGNFQGHMVGLDYSEQSIRLANHLKVRYASAEDDEHHVNVGHMMFDVFDLIKQRPEKAVWWPKGPNGFDLVLDKGTFDAISLSSETAMDSTSTQRRLHELYPAKAAALIRPGGYFLITSCNWTEDEIVHWFSETEGVRGVLKVIDKIKYKTFEFGGSKGQGVTTVCFQKAP